MPDNTSFCCKLSRNDLVLASLLALVVALVFGVRLGALPLQGEESRWARGGVLMMETGDWIVPRQQYRVFPERPPLNSWAMVGAANLRGEFDEVAVRLPSVIAVVLTTLLVFFYSRQFLDTLGAIAAAGAFASLGQVLEIGRLGESEAVFTLFVASSLLLWHWGYNARWPAIVFWGVAYLAVGMAALTKGIQAPVYFASAIGVYLLIRRDWRTLFSWQHGFGILIGVGVVAAWQVPFLLRTEWQDTVAIWFGLVSDRVGTGGLWEHVASYPLETLGCLLPWSLLLPLVCFRSVRQSLAESSDMLLFVCVAVAVAYPSVLFSIGAKGRYFMPLYPCIAVMFGMLVQACLRSGQQSAAFRAWGGYLMLVGSVVVLVALAVVAANFTDKLQLIAIGGVGSVLVAAATLACAVVLFWSTRKPERASHAVFAVVIALGVIFCGVYLPAKGKSRADFESMLATAKTKLPADQPLVSIGSVHHRFCFYYGDSIQQIEWPEKLSDVPEGIDYFCFHRRPSDTPHERGEGRGRVWKSTTGTLPFAWEEITRVPCNSHAGETPGNHIVIARRIRGSGDRIAKIQAFETGREKVQPIR